jgi:hypothetical protein
MLSGDLKPTTAMNTFSAEVCFTSLDPGELANFQVELWYDVVLLPFDIRASIRRIGRNCGDVRVREGNHLRSTGQGSAVNNWECIYCSARDGTFRPLLSAVISLKGNVQALNI